jgi:hypothetical protein
VLQNLERQIVQSAAVTAEERRVSKNKWTEEVSRRLLIEGSMISDSVGLSDDSIVVVGIGSVVRWWR